MTYLLIYSLLTNVGVATNHISFPSYYSDNILVNACETTLKQMKIDYELTGVKFVGRCHPVRP